jgi:hypothetical protein
VLDLIEMMLDTMLVHSGLQVVFRTLRDFQTIHHPADIQVGLVITRPEWLS